ncbi:MAG TPA: FAD binding domain-containing protein [Anaerolineae bacterium]|nr:FAD binding domain-containing protein [Anaerolineae bacterium]
MIDLTIASTLDQARQLDGEFCAGGTDLMDRRRHHISTGAIIDISRLPDLDQIEPHHDGYRLGAHVTVDAVSRHTHIVDHYPGLAIATGALATPQIRFMASMGGVLLQTSRCWYFRNQHFTCYKKGGTTCPARDGDHRFGVVFDTSPCAFPHPSTVGLVLLNYDAQVEINGDRLISIADLYGDGTDGTREHTLGPQDILTRIILPAPLPDERAGYFRAVSRARAEWALVEASARLVVDADNNITFAQTAIGAVAPIPLRLPHVDNYLIGKPATDATFAAAAQLATNNASPLPQTHYKLNLISSTLADTLHRAYHRIWGGEG